MRSMIMFLILIIGTIAFAGDVENWSTYRTAQKAAQASEKAGQYQDASAKYLDAAAICVTLKRPDCEAWMLNNSAYAVIKQHMADKTTDLTGAKKSLEKVIAETRTNKLCIEKAQSNLNYINNFINAQKPSK